MDTLFQFFKKKTFVFTFCMGLFQAFVSSHAQDIAQLGGELSTSLPERAALQVVAPNVTDPARRDLQLSGFGVFHQVRRRRQGLGPRFINQSCGRCHVNNGRGRVRMFRDSRRKNSMVVKVALRGLLENGAPQDVPKVGEQLQDRTIRGKKRHRIRLRWRRVFGEYPDGTQYVLRRPLLRFRVRGQKRSNIVSSLRMAPPMIGLGLLDSIPESAILELSDPEDSNQDGISGVPNYVPSLRDDTFKIGRFGFRASHPTLEQQSAAAAFFDIGVTSPLFNPTSKEAELNENDLMLLTLYQALAGVPRARDQADSQVLQGKQLFQQIGCNSCHHMEFVTENDQSPELDAQVIHPFTDLLLHDMGEGLADERDEYSAKGSEFRTTPLWGLGFAATVSRVKQRYLHDGRARSIEEAILWHGGEAENVKNAFKNLELEQRTAVLRFLESL